MHRDSSVHVERAKYKIEKRQHVLINTVEHGRTFLLFLSTTPVLENRLLRTKTVLTLNVCCFTVLKYTERKKRCFSGKA